MPPIFAYLQDGGNIAPEEMARTFNCGIGMAAIVPNAKEYLRELGPDVFEIGRIEPGRRGCTVSGKAGTWGSDREWSATHHA